MSVKSVRTHEISAEAKKKLRTVSTATLTSQLQKHGLRNTFLAGLYPLRPDLRMVGYAFTLRYIPAREDLADERYDNTRNVQRLAVEAVGAEDVLVVDARGDISAASLGHILGTRITQRGAAGFITDGALRDTPGFRELELPTYIRAPHAQGVHIFKITARIGLDDLHGLGIELRRPHQDSVFFVGAQMTDIGDVLHVEQVEAAITQVTRYHVKRYVGLGMSQMRMLVDRGTTDIHAGAPVLNRHESLFLAP